MRDAFAHARGLPQDCLAMLQAVPLTPNNTNVFPFNAPPLRSYNLDSFGNSSCDDASVVGPRLGGECIRCEPYGTIVVSAQRPLHESACLRSGAIGAGMLLAVLTLPACWQAS